MPVILQLKVTKSIALIGEYVPKKDFVPDSVGQWSVAIEKQVFNHRFALWMGNGRPRPWTSTSAATTAAASPTGT